jgi:hypothetical protein
VKIYGGATLGANTFTGAQTLPEGGSALIFGAMGNIGTLSNAVFLFRNSASNAGIALDVGNDAIASFVNRANSAYAGIRALNYVASLGTAIPAGGSQTIGYRATSTANFGVFFGSGAPTLTAAKGSLYLRSDGGGVGDRAYVATDSAGAWTALTTAT